MRTDQLRINELSSEAFAWYLEYLRVLDAKDIAGYGRLLSPDVTLVMNNAPGLTGRDAVVAGLGDYWQSFGTIEHDLLMILGRDDAFCLEALNHYTSLSGRSVTVRAVAFTERDRDGLADSVRLYTDTTPLFEGE